MSPLLNITEVARRLGVSTKTVRRYRAALKSCEAIRPLGRRKYVAAKIDQFTAGESTVTWRRTA